MLINLQGAAESNTILALAGAIFVIPFILFASLTGTLADRYSKRTLIYITRVAEIIIMILGVLSFAYKSATSSYIVLFLLATHSALFSPCKYGILPEIVKREKLSHYNGIMMGTTYLAIIFGTFLASLLTDLTNKNFVFSGIFCIIIALCALLSSLGLKKTQPQAANKKVSPRFISEVLHTFKKAKETRYLLPAIVFGAYFLFMGAYTQLNIIPYTLQSLGLTEVYGGYLFLMTAVGIGLGSFLAGKFSDSQIELGFVPLALFGVAGCYIGLYLFAGKLPLVVLSLFLIGVFGGFYIVPIDSFIQGASPNQDRGQNVAAANFMSFLGVICAAGLLALLGNGLKLSAQLGFFLVGISTFFLGLLLVAFFLDQILRLLVAKTAKHFWRLKVEGLRPIMTEKPSLLIGMRQSWLDTLIVMATLPRLIRYIVPIRRQIRGRRFLYRLLQLIPLDISYFSPLKELTMQQIKKELMLGHSLCLMQPINNTIATLHEWEKMVATLVPDMDVAVIPIHISRKAVPEKEHGLRSVKMLFSSSPITIRYTHSQK